MQWFSACISKYQFKYCLFAFLLSLPRRTSIELFSFQNMFICNCRFKFLIYSFYFIYFSFYIKYPDCFISVGIEQQKYIGKLRFFFVSSIFCLLVSERSHHTESNHSCKVSFHLFPYELPKCIKIFDLPSQLKHLYGLFHGRFMQERFVSFPCICVSVKHPFIHMDAMSSLLLSNFRTLLLNVDNTV